MFTNENENEHSKLASIRKFFIILYKHSPKFPNSNFNFAFKIIPPFNVIIVLYIIDILRSQYTSRTITPI